VEATLPPSKLRWLSFPGSENEKGSPVKITNRTAWEKGEFREGYLYKLIGSLEGNTRLARVLVEVEDPLASANKITPIATINYWYIYGNKN
jgi:hypothetical protein